MEQITTAESNPAVRWKFIIGGLLIVAAVVYLIVSSTQASAQYFLTVDEINRQGGQHHRARCAHLWSCGWRYGAI